MAAVWGIGMALQEATEITATADREPTCSTITLAARISTAFIAMSAEEDDTIVNPWASRAWASCRSAPGGDRQRRLSRDWQTFA